MIQIDWEIIGNRFLSARNAVEHFFRRYIVPVPRPDFSEEEVVCDLIWTGYRNEEGRICHRQEEIAWFPRYNGFIAQQNCWVENFTEYRTLAGLVFSVRYPNHPHAQGIRQQIPSITDDEIVQIAKGSLWLSVQQLPGSESYRVTWGPHEY
jgi:hypothetical protein